MSRRLPLLLAALVAVLGLGYVGSLLLDGDRVPRGVHVLGIDLSGRSSPQAVAVLGERLAATAAAPVVLVADDVRATLTPAAVGLRMDVAATVADARSAGPLDRLRGLVGIRRDVDPVPVVRPELLAPLLQNVAGRVDRAPREGAVVFRGVSPVAVAPLPGRALDLPGAVEAIRAHYLRTSTIALPVRRAQPRTGQAEVDRAMQSAIAAVAAPVLIDIAGKQVTVQPADLAVALSYRAGQDGALTRRLDPVRLRAALGARLADVEQRPVDATFDVRTGHPVLVPSREGRTVHDGDLGAAVSRVLDDQAPRRTAVSLVVTAPRVTTSLARTLGIREVIGTFTTYHPCCAPRVTNIHTIADILDGYVVLPGETFSLNGVVGRRDVERGFVKAPQILRGQFVKDVGGGISQFATTLFNAVFFSGVRDVQHTPHSYYISRYPPGRESTVSFPEPDFRFQDDAPTGVLIDTAYTATSITVTFWGTPRYAVTAEAGPRTRVTPFGTEYIQRPDCTPSVGAEGFDIVVTRVLSRGGRVVKRQPFRTRYLPEPHFVCGPPPPGQPAKQPPPHA
jgi:vancomycin resistance protein YoaR